MSVNKRSLNVGLLGIGHIGAPLLVHLAFKSRNSMYIQLHSRSHEKATQLADKLQRDGCQSALRVHTKYSTLTKWCDVIVSCVGSVDASRSVMLTHPEAIVKNARRGQIIVDHGPADVELAKACYDEAARRGAHYIDAPISGSVAHAHNGLLTVMAGGDAEAFERVVAMIRLYAENVHHMGGAGSGAATKTIEQALTAIHTVAAAEAVTIAHQLGVADVAKVIRVLDATEASSAMLRKHGAKMQKLIRNSDDIPEKSPTCVDRVLHDIGVAAKSVDLPLLSTTRRVFAQASHAGVGDRDSASVIHFLDNAGDVQEVVRQAEAPPRTTDASGPQGAEPSTEFY